MTLFEAVGVARRVLCGVHVSSVEKDKAYKVLADWHPKIAAFEHAANKSNELIKEVYLGSPS